MILAHLLQAASNLAAEKSALQSSISALESSISALESDIIKLGKSSAPWEIWMPRFSAIVAVGVAMEVWVILHEWRDDTEAWALSYGFGLLRMPARPSVLKLWVEIGSVTLIVAGIVLECWDGIKIASFNESIRADNALLQSKGAELRGKSEQLVSLTDEAAEEARRDAAKARLELGRFKAPRTLSQEQQQKIASSVAHFTGQKFAMAVFPEPEPIALAVIVNKVLKSAGWERVPSQIHREGSGVLIDIAGVSAAEISDAGVEAYIAPDEVESENAQKAFCAALRASGIPCERHRTPQLAGKTPRAITISIGKKP